MPQAVFPSLPFAPAPVHFCRFFRPAGPSLPSPAMRKAGRRRRVPAFRPFPFGISGRSAESASAVLPARAPYGHAISALPGDGASPAPGAETSRILVVSSASFLRHRTYALRRAESPARFSGNAVAAGSRHPNIIPCPGHTRTARACSWQGFRIRCVRAAVPGRGTARKGRTRTACGRITHT